MCKASRMVALGIVLRSPFSHPSFSACWDSSPIWNNPTPMPGSKSHQHNWVHRDVAGGGDGRTAVIFNRMDAPPGPGLLPTHPSASLPTLPQVNKCRGWKTPMAGFSGMHVGLVLVFGAGHPKSHLQHLSGPLGAPEKGFTCLFLPYHLSCLLAAKPL